MSDDKVPSITAGAQATASAAVTGQLGPLERHTLIIGVLATVILLGSLVGNGIFPNPMWYVATGLGVVGVGGVLWKYFRTTHLVTHDASPTVLTAQFGTDSVSVTSNNLDQKRTLQLLRLLTTQRQRLVPYGEVRNGAVLDESGLREYSPQEQARVAKEIEEAAEQHEATIPKAIRESVAVEIDDAAREGGDQVIESTKLLAQQPQV